jgi:transcriptional regulator with XRE-family HTH domain
MSRKKYQHDEKTFGGRLRFYRRKNLQNMQDFAKLLGIAQSSLSTYENNEAEPSLSFFTALNRNTDINLTWLLDGTGGMYNKNKISRAQILKEDTEAYSVPEKSSEVVALEKRITHLESECRELRKEVTDLRETLKLAIPQIYPEESAA